MLGIDFACAAMPHCKDPRGPVFWRDLDRQQCGCLKSYEKGRHSRAHCRMRLFGATPKKKDGRRSKDCGKGVSLNTLVKDTAETGPP